MSNTIRLELRAAVDAVMATAWMPPAEPSAETLLKADAEAQRLMGEWERLTHKVETEDDQEAIQPIIDHANLLVKYLLSAPVQSAATAAASMRHLITDVSGIGIDASCPGDLHCTGFGRVLEWLEAVAARQNRADAERARLEKIEEQVQAQLRGEIERKPARPELVAAVDAVLAAGWSPPAGGILTEESLIAAEREIVRLWQEHDRLYGDLEQRGRVTGADEDEVNRLWDRADELTELALSAQVSTICGALTMLRLLRLHAFERKIEIWDELYPAAMDRVLAVVEGAKEKR